MVATHYPWGVLVEAPCEEGARDFLRSLGDEKLWDLSLLCKHELVLVYFVVDHYPAVARQALAEVKSRRGLLLQEGACLRPGHA